MHMCIFTAQFERTLILSLLLFVDFVFRIRIADLFFIFLKTKIIVTENFLGLLCFCFLLTFIKGSEQAGGSLN